MERSSGMWICPRGHRPAEFIVHLNEELDPDGIGVLVYPDGEPTNRWADGTAGISVEQANFAREEETAYCTECGSDPETTLEPSLEARWVEPVRIILEVNYLPEEGEITKVGDPRNIGGRLADRVRFGIVGPPLKRDPQVYSVNVEVPDA